MKSLLKNKGITLVALVVTIIVLIILAGVSISLILGQDGIVQKAKQGRDNYAEAARLENEQLANVDAFAMDIEDMIPVSQEPEIFTPTGTVSNMTNGEIEISATVSLTGDLDLTKTKYAFTTSNTPLGTDDETLYKDGVITQANATITKSKAAGTYYLHILVTNSSGAKGELISNTTATSQGKKELNYTGRIESIALTIGNYKIECWGAQGANSYSSGGVGKKGAYVSGNFEFTDYTNLQILVGEQGKTGSSAGNWQAGGGGGGTFVALGTSYSNASPLIIAGGGGGATISYATNGKAAGDTVYNNANQEYSITKSSQNGGGTGAGFTYNGTTNHGDIAYSFKNGGAGASYGYTTGVQGGGFGGGGCGGGNPGGGGRRICWRLKWCWRYKW